MNWNYGVIRTRTSFGDLYQVYEVYYANDGEITPWTENPINPSGETIDELKEEFSRQLLSLETDGLNYDQLK